jgi:hypothetical protein
MFGTPQKNLQSKDLQHRPLSEPLDLLIHFPSKHQSKHLEITQKGPKWMPKRGRNIPLDKEMAVPGKSIPKEWHKEQKPPAKNH